MLLNVPNCPALTVNVERGDQFSREHVRIKSGQSPGASFGDALLRPFDVERGDLELPVAVEGDRHRLIESEHVDRARFTLLRTYADRYGQNRREQGVAC